MSSDRQDSTPLTNDGEVEQPLSSPQSTAECEVQRLNLGRSSSPAKRTVSERDGDDGDESYGGELDGTGRVKSPKSELVSPMPSRHKPIPSIELNAQSMPDDDDDDMLEVVQSVPLPSQQPAESVIGHGQGAAVPSLDEQVRQITEIAKKPAKEGDKGYAVAQAWLDRVHSRTSDGLHGGFTKELREGEIGPVDNSSIVANDNFYGDLKDQNGDQFIPLQEGLSYGQDFICLPPEAWDLIMQWYGVAEASHVVVRYLRNTAEAGAKGENLQYECWPPIFMIQKLRNDSGGMTRHQLADNNAFAAVLLGSRTEGRQAFLKRAKTAAGIDMKTKVQVWKLMEVQETAPTNSAMPSPPPSPGNSPTAPSALARIKPRLLIDLNAFNKFVEGTNLERLPLKDQTADENYNGKSTLDLMGFGSEQTIILEEQIKDTDDFVSDKMKKTAASAGVDLESSQELPPRTNARTRAQANSARTSSPAGVLTRARNKKGRIRGCTGLTNLGNTCYMNSALQCIRSVEELAIYLLEGKHKSEINSDNPLGHGGQIVKSYEGFLHSVYSVESTGSFAPRNFKTTLGRCQPLFSGYGQQDSQEFLSFLVDGLHEDLNRVLKKPYRENPDSDDKKVHDPEYIKELGEVYRDNHRARNDSVAMDLFSGFYKNTMVCPVCDKVSVTFDPYSLLTLQLPIEAAFQHTIAFAPLTGRPINVQVDIDKNSNIRMLKEYIAKRFPGTKAENLILIETYGHKIYKVFEDWEVIAEANIQANDYIWMFELDGVPTNLTAKQMKKIGFRLGSKSSDPDLTSADSPLAERMAIPIVHRCAEADSRDLLLRPWILIITREEAKDLDKIKRKILRMVQCMTTRELFDDQPKNKLDEEQSEDTVLMTQDDKDDDGLQARSVESEESLVDVTMSGGEATSAPNSTVRAAPHAVKPSRVLDPNYFVDPYLNNSFNLFIYGDGSEPIPTGWHGLTVNSNLPNIEGRMQHAASRRQSRQSNSSYTSHKGRDNLAPADSDDEEGRDGRAMSATPSDTEDALTASASPRRNSRFRNKMSDMKSDIKRSLSRFGRKGDRRSSSTSPQQELLIRPGEGLVVDWHIDAYNGLFGGDGKDDLRGQPSVDERDMPLFEDKELEAKRAKRNARKKSGVTLEECFEETSKSEVLSEENAWYCGQCKELRRATKTLEIWTAPDILVIHLKRFSSTSRLRDKIDVLVDAPVEGLDLAGKVGLPEGKPLVYDLFAVDNHYGGLGGGHYTAYAQNFFDKQWYEYNDSSVSSASASGVVTKAAYLLFYRRRSDKPLGPPYLQQIVNEAYAAAESSESALLSGEDQRPEDSSSPNGSSTSSPEAAAATRHLNAATRSSPGLSSNAQPLASGLIGGRGRESETSMGLSRTEVSPPTYDEAYGPTIMEDEGIGMDMNPDVPIASKEERGNENYSLETFRRVAGWSFSGLPQDQDQDMGDADSIAPHGGSSGGATLSDRMNDFDGMDDGPIGIDHNDDYAGGFEHVEHVGLMGGGDGPVHEINVDGDEDDVLPDLPQRAEGFQSFYQRDE